MPVISTPQGFNEEELYVDLEPMFGQSLFLKCEGFNFAGSIKLKAATEMVEAAERDGVLAPGSVLVESSSGNLGVALSMIAANKGYGFLCVTDSRCNLSTRRLMQALGSQVHVISEPDAVGGFLGALASDVARYLLTSPALSYSVVFASEAGLFVISACMAVWVYRAPARRAMRQGSPGDVRAAAVAGGARS